MYASFFRVVACDCTCICTFICPYKIRTAYTSMCVCVCIHGFILCIIPRMRLQEIERGATQGTIGHRVCVFFFCCVCLCVEHTVKSISTALLLDKMRSPKVDHGPRTSVNPS